VDSTVDTLGWQRKIIARMLMLMVAFSLCFALIASLSYRPRTLVMALVSAVVYSLLLIPLNYFKPKLSIFGALLMLQLSAFYFMLIGEGIHDIILLLLPCVILLAGLNFNKKVYWSFVALSLMSVGVTGWCEMSGIIHPAYSNLTNWADVLTISLLLFALSLFVNILISNLLRSLNRAMRNERSFYELFNATNEAIVILDGHSGAVLEVNQTMLQMFGYQTPQQLSALNINELLNDGAGVVSAHIGADCSQSTPCTPKSFESRVCHSNGEPFWIEVTLRRSAILDRDCILVVIRNISERKRLQEEHQQSEKLIAIGALAGGVAHDFNNQLAGITGFADMLRLELEPGTSRHEYVMGILTATRRAAHLTQKLLAFARKGPYKLSTVDIHKIIDEITTILRHSIDKRIIVESRLLAQHCITAGDAGMLQSALLNLALNARDAMPQGGALRFETRNMTIPSSQIQPQGVALQQGDYIVVEVADSGCGMDEKTMKRIFEPFFTTKEPGKGTGMGLAAVYGTIQTHRGHIDVRSMPGVGSTFTVYLKCEDGRVAAEPSPHSSTLEPAPIEAATILVVDDEPLVARMVTVLLTKMDYSPIVSTSPAEALHLYEQQWSTIDLVILDMVMPGMSGGELFTQLRSINPQARVLIASGYSLTGQIQEVLDKGALGFVQKPFELATLAQNIGQALRF
jgi:PAS domain S-box-containing protein